MVNRFQFLLTKLAEEATEVAQIALKTQQFGLDSESPYTGETNRLLLQKEFNDIWAVVSKLNKEFGVGCLIDTDLQINKDVKLEKYYQYSKDLGMVYDTLQK